jgi:hypothetical protein
MLCGSVFIAAQTLMIFRPVANPVPIASPLADEWLVGQGGHAELVNYHRVTSTQRDALSTFSKLATAVPTSREVQN